MSFVIRIRHLGSPYRGNVEADTAATQVCAWYVSTVTGASVVTGACCNCCNKHYTVLPPAGPFGGGGDSPPPPTKKNQLLPPNFFTDFICIHPAWAPYLYSRLLPPPPPPPPPKSFNSPPPKRWNPAENPDLFISFGSPSNSRFVSEPRIAAPVVSVWHFHYIHQSWQRLSPHVRVFHWNLLLWAIL